MKTVYLWIREDGRPPKCLEEGKRPPGPGKVVAVRLPDGAGGTGLAIVRARRLWAQSQHEPQDLSKIKDATLRREARDRLADREEALGFIDEVAFEEESGG